MTQKSQHPTEGRRGIEATSTTKLPPAALPVNAPFWTIPGLALFLEERPPDLLAGLDAVRDLYRKASGHPLIRPEAARRLIEAQLQEVGHA